MGSSITSPQINEPAKWLLPWCLLGELQCETLQFILQSSIYCSEAQSDYSCLYPGKLSNPSWPREIQIILEKGALSELKALTSSKIHVPVAEQSIGVNASPID